MPILINPGSDSVANKGQEQSEINIKKFIEDIGLADITYEYKGLQDDGRHFYELMNPKLDDRCVEIDIPAIPLDEIRYMDLPGQNIFDFPRLYIGGSSWVWKNGINVALDLLTQTEEEDD